MRDKGGQESKRDKGARGKDGETGRRREGKTIEN
jgi:hypothetical protein